MRYLSALIVLLILPLFALACDYTARGVTCATGPAVQQAPVYTVQAAPVVQQAPAYTLQAPVFFQAPVYTNPVFAPSYAPFAVQRSFATGYGVRQSFGIREVAPVRQRTVERHGVFGRTVIRTVIGP